MSSLIGYKAQSYRLAEPKTKGKTGMKLRKLICMLLAFAFIIFSFAACAEEEVGIDDGGDRGPDGSWDNVDFGGSELKICVSANQDSEVTFPAANIYTMGPDSGTSTDEVQKKVIQRNNSVAQMLNLDVKYTKSNLAYNEVLDDIDRYVRGAAADAPDIYNNDMYGLSRAMVNGYLWNVKNPGNDVNGNPVKNYFEFTYVGWNYEFMKGCTFDQEKMYILAGDYFLDMIRMAWVIYVNVDMFNASAEALDYEDINEFYEYVENGYWDFTYMTDFANLIWRDNGKKDLVADPADESVGLAINHVSDWIFLSSTGVTQLYQDENYVPRVLDSIDVYEQMANKFRLIQSGGTPNGYDPVYTGNGIYYEREVLSSTEYFFNGNFLMAVSVLGELESAAMRGIVFNKGLVPMPKWDERFQENYHTMVHDQTELGAILNNATSFGRASAFMQAVNEESKDVIHEYYEKGLKFKYNDDKGIRSMIDLVYNTIDSPFGMQLEFVLDVVIEKSLGTAACDGTVSSTFAANKIAYETGLKNAIEKFKKLH